MRAGCNFRGEQWQKWNETPRGEKAVAELTLVRHVENDDDTVSTSVVRACNCPETFLTSSVPDLNIKIRMMLPKANAKQRRGGPAA